MTLCPASHSEYAQTVKKLYIQSLQTRKISMIAISYEILSCKINLHAGIFTLPFF